MLDLLDDFQIRDIKTKSEYSNNGIYYLGAIIYETLKESLSKRIINGCYYTHYSSPYFHVKVGIMYESLKDLNILNSILNSICVDESHIINESGRFQKTQGTVEYLGDNIIVDYIICYSFEWLIKVKEEFNKEIPSYEALGNFFIKNRKNIEDEIFSSKIIRKGKLKSLNNLEKGVIWNRFIHHLCNSYIYPYEAKLIGFLKRHNIPIILHQTK